MKSLLFMCLTLCLLSVGAFAEGISKYSQKQQSSKDLIYKSLNLPNDKEFLQVEIFLALLTSENEWGYSYFTNKDFGTAGRNITIMMASDDARTYTFAFNLDDKNFLTLTITEIVFDNLASIVNDIKRKKESGKYVQKSTNNNFQCLEKKGELEKVCYNVSGQSFGTKTVLSVFKSNIDDIKPLKK